MDRDRGVRSGTCSGPGGKARCGQFTGDTQLSLLSAKNAGHTGLKPIMQAVFSTSTWHAFAGHVSEECRREGAVETDRRVIRVIRHRFDLLNCLRERAAPRRRAA